MTVGLSKFKEHFEEFQGQYVLIGGTACFMLLTEGGFDFRRTKDLDIVLCVEALTAEFVEHFWKFIKEGMYEIQCKTTGEKCFYRFEKPKTVGFPEMIEILSNKPDIFTEREPGSIIPIAVGEDIVSLSAILLNPEYYGFIRDRNVEIDGITVATELCIIPLKARAWVDLSEKKSLLSESEQFKVKGSDIAKHKNDIYRMSQLIPEIPLENVPKMIKDDIYAFVSRIMDTDELLKQLKIDGITMDEIKRRLLLIYCS